MLRQREEEEQQRRERLEREQVEAQRNLAARVLSSTTEVRACCAVDSYGAGVFKKWLG